MKKIALATVFSVAATGAFAGGMVTEPVQPAPAPAPVVVEESSPASGGFVIPLMLLAVVAAIAASD